MERRGGEGRGTQEREESNARDSSRQGSVGRPSGDGIAVVSRCEDARYNVNGKNAIGRGAPRCAKFLPPIKIDGTNSLSSFARKKNLEKAADRTPPVLSGNNRISCHYRQVSPSVDSVRVDQASGIRRSITRLWTRKRKGAIKNTRF